MNSKQHQMTAKDMEGILWKWTNYFTGWQPRWFVLDTGILSYYKSQDDVNNGCKGSIKMSVCDVIVHPTDSTRLDLIIPGEAHFYVKAATAQERQHWLVALGSSKACLRNGKKAVVEEEMSEDALRAKKSELRLYCDLLMQQVHSVKSAVQEEPTPQRLDDATSLLSATCDTFIVTLEDCMRLANASAPYPNAPASPHVVDSALPASPSRKSSQSKTPNSRPNSIQRSTSSDRNSVSTSNHHTPNDPYSPGGSIVQGYIPSGNKVQRSARSSISRSRTPSESSELSGSEKEPKERLTRDTAREFRSPHGVAGPPAGAAAAAAAGGATVAPKAEIAEESDENDEEPEEHITPPSSPTPRRSPSDRRIDTMFSTMSTSFMDIKLDKDGGVPVLPFLDACNNVLLIFDKLNPTAFMPIKMDISGNIKKIKQKYSTDIEHFKTLQSIVKYEVQQQQATMSHSATIALLWLKRAMMFIREFLAEVLSGSVELEECAYNAYSRTLREYHGLVIRGVFTVAVKSVPERKHFLMQLAHNPDEAEKPGFQEWVLKEIDDYITAQDVLIKIVDDYYASQDLDTKTLM